MTLQSLPFRTRARTIDHLGREQIADCPTAVSELWKNAYDAYARSVELHIFDGEVPIAAVLDDGHGMSLDEFTDRWLMVGTEAKVDGAEVPVGDRAGLPQREKHGQKGIGRLSVAALGPVSLVISKRAARPFVAALVDWRLFENPFLHLEDILLPVQEFDDRSELPGILAAMQEVLVANVWGRSGDGGRNNRLEQAWQRYDATLLTQGARPPSAEIAKSALGVALLPRHLSQWATWRGESEHGTALFVLGANYELAVWNDPLAQEKAEPKKIQDLLKETLTAFVDPFPTTGTDPADFWYRVVNHHGTLDRQILSRGDYFGIDNLLTLEHFIEGSFDETGMFRGRVRAFGTDIPGVKVPPAEPPPLRGAGYVGPFDFCLGTFEVDLRNTTHPPELHRVLMEKVERFSGLAIYRDGLRVMPYGRPESDYFGIEQRRSTHAGRWFWSHRRSFGRVAIKRATNPHLRDKAGREGLIDNRARREMQGLVVNLLRNTALTYFGSESDLRKEHLPEIQATYDKAKLDDEKASRRRRTLFGTAIAQKSADLDEAISVGHAAAGELARVRALGLADGLLALDDTLADLSRRRTALRLPPRPLKLAAR